MRIDVAVEANVTISALVKYSASLLQLKPQIYVNPAKGEISSVMCGSACKGCNGAITVCNLHICVFWLTLALTKNYREA